MSEVLKTMVSPTDSMLMHLASDSSACPSNDDILAFVQAALGADAVEEVHIHLDGCGQCQRLVAEAAHAIGSAPISESVRPSWNTVFHTNTMIAKRYRILGLVARGGMGEIYEAFDTALHERVALKTVTATHCDNEQAVRLLKAEVQLARRISHPNVCRIFDFGTHSMDPSGGEINFLVMEFVEGVTLGKKLRQFGALEIESAVSIARQLLQGLAAAHQAGIIHRDFKSDNVMLREESRGQLTPVILDFGLAKVLNERGTLGPTQNQGQAMVGTIGYMAPEQVEGEPLSAASDIYAFGIVWFEMLTGRLPFEAETPVASAMARLHRAPLPPSRLNPKVPKWLDDIVLRCMGRHRRDRFASAEQVLEALSARMAVPEIQTERPSRVQRSRWLSLLVATIVGVTVVALLRRPLPAIRAELLPELVSPAPSGLRAMRAYFPKALALGIADSVTTMTPRSGVVTKPRAPSREVDRTRDLPPVASPPPATSSVTAPSAPRTEPTPIDPKSEGPNWLPMSKQSLRRDSPPN